MSTVNGSYGPYNSNALGGFGRNAAANAFIMQEDNPAKLAKSDIQVSRGPQSSPYHPRNDYLAYASEEIRYFDKNGDNKLDKIELKQAFGDEAKANKFLSVVNQDGKDGLSVVDLTAHLYMQDGVAELTKGTSSDVDKIVKNAQTANKGALKLDGKVSVAENQAASEIIDKKPEIAGKILKSLQSKLELDGWYKEFKAKGGENVYAAAPTPPDYSTGPVPGYVHPYFPPTNDYAEVPPANNYQAVNNTPPVNNYAPVNNYTAVDQTQQVSYPPAQNQSYALGSDFQQQILQLFQALISMLTQFIPQMAYAGVQR